LEDVTNAYRDDVEKICEAGDALKLSMNSNRSSVSAEIVIKTAQAR
jgi:hypothetical protein